MSPGIIIITFVIVITAITIIISSIVVIVVAVVITTSSSSCARRPCWVSSAMLRESPTPCNQCLGFSVLYKIIRARPSAEGNGSPRPRAVRIFSYTWSQ